ncbi:MAG: RdgB/HAM1 family non-canonical purine NTP pyrophosphatase [Burkholderiales bacterium]|jgi:XTP/dITP diphosphohydrolase|nr:RdgB/HAM1 family non-canonical purine NTP pyrophosphatase [Burkholderiales bacterium]
MQQLFPKLVLASHNPGKCREFTQLLSPLGIMVISQGSLNISEAEEPHATFVENALAKARHASRHSGLPALSDDSGLCVSALGDQPGVMSARYAGEPRSDERNNQLLIRSLQPHVNRRARYFCALVLTRHADDPMPIIACGSWAGTIIDTPRGHNGFGYDPYFLTDTGKTAAELSAEEKNALSHRGQALVSLFTQLSMWQK